MLCRTPRTSAAAPSWTRTKPFPSPLGCVPETRRRQRHPGTAFPLNNKASWNTTRITKRVSLVRSCETRVKRRTAMHPTQQHTQESRRRPYASPRAAPANLKYFRRHDVNIHSMSPFSSGPIRLLCDVYVLERSNFVARTSILVQLEERVVRSIHSDLFAA